MARKDDTKIIKLPFHLKEHHNDYHNEIRNRISQVTHLRGPTINLYKIKTFFGIKAKMSKPVINFLLRDDEWR